MGKASGPFLVSADTDTMPGKAILRFVEIKEEIVNANSAEFLNREFRLIDQRNPRIAELKRVLVGK